MSSYYAKKLAGERLRRCYEVASPRVKQYLKAELTHVINRLKRTDEVLELGCGYGRVALEIAKSVKHVVGIDIAQESIELAQKLDHESRSEFIRMDALDLQFPDNTFDAVLCIQNGICAFNIDQITLLKEALRVTRSKGLVLLSTYSDPFWPDRLKWFEAQAAEGLVGPLDRDRCGDGIIVCADGFSSGRMTPEDFRSLCSKIHVEPEITEIDASSVFCEIAKR